MKESYIYKSGNIETTDFKEGKETKEIYEYQDNIGEILETQNIIEELSKKANQITYDISKIYEKHSKKSINIFKLFTILMCLFSLASLAVVGLFTTILTSIICVIGMFLIIYLPILISMENSSKNYLKNINAKSSEFKETLEKMKKQRIKLGKLLSDNTKNKESEMLENKKYIINYKDKLYEIKKELGLYYKIVYNEDKYKKYYEQGIIDKKLEKQYDNNERKLIKRYFDNNA